MILGTDGKAKQCWIDDGYGNAALGNMRPRPTDDMNGGQYMNISPTKYGCTALMRYKFSDHVGGKRGAYMLDPSLGNNVDHGYIKGSSTAGVSQAEYDKVFYPRSVTSSTHSYEVEVLGTRNTIYGVQSFSDFIDHHATGELGNPRRVLYHSPATKMDTEDKILPPGMTNCIPENGKAVIAVVVRRAGTSISDLAFKASGIGFYSSSIARYNPTGDATNLPGWDMYGGYSLVIKTFSSANYSCQFTYNNVINYYFSWVYDLDAWSTARQRPGSNILTSGDTFWMPGLYAPSGGIQLIEVLLGFFI